MTRGERRPETLRPEEPTAARQCVEEILPQHPPLFPIRLVDGVMIQLFDGHHRERARARGEMAIEATA